MSPTPGPVGPLRVAVWGTGIDVVYPKENKKLAEEILAAGGAIVSEMPMGTFPAPQNFPIWKSLNVVKPVAWVEVDVRVPMVGEDQLGLLNLSIFKAEVVTPGSRSPGFIKVNAAL